MSREKIGTRRVAVHCSCNNTFELIAGEGQESWNINSCPKCHSAYVKTKAVKRQGRIAKFASKYKDSKWDKYIDKDA